MLTRTGLSLIQVLIPGYRALAGGSWSSGLLREIKARAEETLGAMSPAQPPEALYSRLPKKATLRPLGELVLYATHQFWVLIWWE